MTDRIPTVVWGTGNVGRAAIRSVLAHPGLDLAAVVVHDPAKVGRDAGDLARMDTRMDRSVGVTATDDVEAGLAAAAGGALVYAASGDIRPDDAVADIIRALAAGAVVVTPSVYPMYDPSSAPSELRDPLEAAARQGRSALFVSGVDPGWGNDVLPLWLTAIASVVTQVRCQEIFDYAGYDQPDSVRFLVGMGQPMDYEPPMVAPTVPTMVWGGQIRLMARALGVELDEIRETVLRRPLEATVTNQMGEFAEGTQGALRFEVQGIVAGEPRIVIEHVTRITPGAAPDWPQPPAGTEGSHKVIIEGDPRIEVTVQATAGSGGNADGGNATAVGRLVNAVPWLRAAPPGLYDALEVPMAPAVGRLG